MQWLKRLFSGGGRRAPDTALWIYVRCRRCGEAIRLRLDRRYDVASEWRTPGEPGSAYTMHKDIVGNRCFQRIAVDIGFDARMQIVEHHITGGDLLTADEYAALTDQPSDPTSPV
jgi:hypothetical protein